METASSTTPSAQIYTHHCLCSNIILATTHTIAKLPRRAEPSLDNAYILPCPPLPRLDGEDDGGADSDAVADLPRQYTLLISLAAQAPLTVRRRDGFEKRYRLRCGRCSLVIGYHLDWAQFRKEEEQAEEMGRRSDVVYILPGALVTTEEMKEGKRPRDEELAFGLKGS